MENREFDSRYHHELQEMWYKAHYNEAEKIRARPLGKSGISLLKLERVAASEGLTFATLNGR